MSDKPNDKTNNDRPASLVRWGRQPDAALYELRDRLVNVKCLDNKIYKGKLTGLGVYQFVITQSNGLELVFGKGALVYIHAAAVEVER